MLIRCCHARRGRKVARKLFDYAPYVLRHDGAIFRACGGEQLKKRQAYSYTIYDVRVPKAASDVRELRMEDLDCN
jgi:hypothetical protein